MTVDIAGKGMPWSTAPVPQSNGNGGGVAFLKWAVSGDAFVNAGVKNIRAGPFKISNPLRADGPDRACNPYRAAVPARLAEEVRGSLRPIHL